MDKWRITKKEEDVLMEGLIMNRKIELVMTEEQWEERFKNNVRRWVRRKAVAAMPYAFMVSLPVLFVIYWLVIGY